MLHLIRTKQKSIIVRFIFWVIIAAFVGTVFLVWGRGGERGPSAGNAALQVNDTAISYEEYQSTYNNLRNLYQGVYRKSFTPELEKQLNLPKQAVDQLISQALMMQEAERSDLDVSKDELVSAIAKYPSFQQDGKFNRKRYLQVLNYQRLSPDKFEASQRRQLLADKLRTQLQKGLTVNSAEMKAAYHQENDKINLNFVRLLPASFESKVKVDDKGLQTYFDAKKEDFRQPEKIALRYVIFKPAQYEKEITDIPATELSRYYRRNIDQFEVKEQAKAAHILIKVAKDASAKKKTARRALAVSILKKLKAGKDFAALARANSEDPGSAPKGGELGYFTRGTMVAPFEDAVFALKPGQLSDIVETQFGYHIIKLEKYIKPRVKPESEVLTELKKGLRAEKSQQLAYEKAMDAYNINRKSGDLDAAAKTNGLSIKETGLFEDDESIEGIGKETAILDAAFILKSGELSHPVQTSKGVYLFTIKKRKPSRIPDLKEIRTAVVAAYRKVQAIDLAKAAADRLLKAAQDKKSLNRAAKAAKVQIEETGLFSHSYGSFVPRLGSSQELADAAFALSSKKPLGSVVFNQNGGFVLISLKQTEKSALEKLSATEQKKLEDRLLTKKKAAVVDQKLKELRTAAQININPSLENELAGR